MRIFLIVIFVFLSALFMYSQQEDSTSLKRKPLEEVFREHQEELLSIPGVQGFYQSALENGDDLIVIMLDEATPENKAAIPDSLEGYPVKIEVSGKIRPLEEKKKSPEE